MTRRTDDDDFELLNTQEEDDSFEILPKASNSSSSSLIATNPIQLVNKIDKPNVDEPENSPKSLPVRYGAAAAIPHNESFDLKSILSMKTERPKPTNDLLSILQQSKPQHHLPKENNLQQFLIDSDHDRQSLVLVARKAQQDFIDAIRLD